MRSFTRLAMVGLFFIVSTAVFAQAEKTRWEEHNTLIRQRQTIAPLDGAMFGDSVSYYTGSLGFAQTDTSIAPGRGDAHLWSDGSPQSLCEPRVW